MQARRVSRQLVLAALRGDHLARKKPEAGWPFPAPAAFPHLSDELQRRQDEQCLMLERAIRGEPEPQHHEPAEDDPCRSPLA